MNPTVKLVLEFQPKLKVENAGIFIIVLKYKDLRTNKSQQEL